MKLSKKFWWTLSLTWGLPLTLLGLIVATILLAFGIKPYSHMYATCFVVGHNWGGLNLGPIIITSKESAHIDILNHEFGHSIQNCYLGPLTPILISIPSACRYWYREWLVHSGRKQYSQLVPYDSIWFEGSATSLGEKYWKAQFN